MSSRVMTLADFRQYLRRLKAQLTGHEGAVIKGIHSGVLRSVAAAQFSTDHAAPASANGSSGAVDTGAYRQAWSFELMPRGGRVFNAARYADVIERGRRKKRKPPPVAAIRAWAKRKLRLSDEEAARAAYPIAKAIGKRGLIGRRVLTNPATRDKITRLVLEEIEREVRAALARGGRR